jgi:hypothetical protein
MNKDEALKQAMEALNLFAFNGEPLVINAIKAIEESLEAEQVYETQIYPNGDSPEWNLSKLKPAQYSSLNEFIAEMEKDHEFKELMQQERAKLLAYFQALEQPAQEPVAICKTQPLGGCDSIRQYKILWLNGNPVEGKLYTHPAPQTSQEPLGWIPATYKYNLLSNDDEYPIGMVYHSKRDKDDVAVYIHPHQDGTSPSEARNKEFVTLTDDEMWAIEAMCLVGNPADWEVEPKRFARAIEQALKEKNT